METLLHLGLDVHAGTIACALADGHGQVADLPESFHTRVRSA